MKISFDVELNLMTKKAAKDVTEATRESLRDTVVAIHNDAVRGSPVLTGHNRRSIASEVSGMGTVQQRGQEVRPIPFMQPERIVDDTKLEGAVYSTSGYGGYLETGTAKMAAQPYFKPAYDRNIGKLGKVISEKLEK